MHTFYLWACALIAVLLVTLPTSQGEGLARESPYTK